MDWIPPSKLGEGVAWPEDRVHCEAETDKKKKKKKKRKEHYKVDSEISALIYCMPNMIKIDTKYIYTHLLK